MSLKYLHFRDIETWKKYVNDYIYQKKPFKFTGPSGKSFRVEHPLESLGKSIYIHLYPYTYLESAVVCLNIRYTSCLIDSWLSITDWGIVAGCIQVMAFHYQADVEAMAPSPMSPAIVRSARPAPGNRGTGDGASLHSKGMGRPVNKVKIHKGQERPRDSAVNPKDIFSSTLTPEYATVWKLCSRSWQTALSHTPKSQHMCLHIYIYLHIDTYRWYRWCTDKRLKYPLYLL